MDMAAIDQVHLNFNPQGLMVINMAIGLMMLGVALDLKIDDFKRILKSPKAPAIGMLAQFVFLPAFTFLLILVLRPHPSMALGMILVAWWGVWHIISGLTTAFIFSRQILPAGEAEVEADCRLP